LNFTTDHIGTLLHRDNLINEPFDAHMGTAIGLKHPMPDRVKPLFDIFDIRAL